MYLFLHFWQNPRKYQIRLYIPQCIYFYEMRFDDETNCEKLYIPQCIYFYPICRSRTKPRKCFTFHNVSISTGVLSHSVTNTSTFTFHNVSISTTERPQILPAQPPLHSTMYLFLPRTYLLMSCLWHTLHSTMYLFLPWGQQLLFTHSTSFTFHNVSISTQCRHGHDRRKSNFTFHNVSISTCQKPCTAVNQQTLHSTMYLFLPSSLLIIVTAQAHFTFHNVSISTSYNGQTMKLLCAFTFHNVSISTYGDEGWVVGLQFFTFHNVSISTLISPVHDKDKNPFTFHNVSISTEIQTFLKFQQVLFTFHNVSISTFCLIVTVPFPTAFTFHNVSISTIQKD